MSFSIFNINIPNNCELTQRDINLETAIFNEIRLGIQEYHNEYPTLLNPQIVNIFNKLISQFSTLTNISRNIIMRSTQINALPVTLTNTVPNPDDPNFIRETQTIAKNKIIINRCKFAAWYVLFCENHIRTAYEIFEDIILLFHISQQHNNGNEEYTNLITNINTLLNDYDLYVNDINTFHQSLNSYTNSIGQNLNKTIHNIEHDYESFYDQLNNRQQDFETRINTYTESLTLLVRGPNQGQNTVANQEVITAPAFEIHNYFKSLNIDRIKEIMVSYSSQKEQNPNTIDTTNTNNTIFKPFYIFIQKSNLFSANEKQIYTNKFKTIYEYIINNDYDNDLSKQSDILNIAINFIVRQDDNYISEFIRSYQDACLNAFKKGGYSCVPGMIERVLTENGIIINAKCLSGCEEPYNELNSLFNRTLNDVIQLWSNTYLEDGPKYEELVSLSEEDRKKHLIKFIKDSYNNIIDQNLAAQIEKELDNYEKQGVFKNLYFGGKKRKQTNKRKTNKTIKKHLVKRKQTNKRKNTKINKRNKKRSNKKLN